jgi:hypothetical protein
MGYPKICSRCMCGVVRAALYVRCCTCGVVHAVLYVRCCMCSVVPYNVDITTLQNYKCSEK